MERLLAKLVTASRLDHGTSDAKTQRIIAHAPQTNSSCSSGTCILPTNSEDHQNAFSMTATIELIPAPTSRNPQILTTSQNEGSPAHVATVIAADEPRYFTLED
ncbi:hypothetical protein IE4872_PD02046 (plasmid) [Rhizobium gallicum]|uniref:Uncharacterized protein n=1 Tax=Rhizobium gallicum TaxID=56730 RepID=A0A1L5NXD4_9HYPH|nr:hypothetical protein IE4872_PD02046 [Rhizobium gallicum]